MLPCPPPRALTPPARLVPPRAPRRPPPPPCPPALRRSLRHPLPAALAARKPLRDTRRAAAPGPASRAPGPKDAAGTAGEGPAPGPLPPPKPVPHPKLAPAKEAPKAMPTSTTSFAAEPGLRMFHLAMFFVVLAAGLLFLAALLYVNGDMQFQSACAKVLRRLMKTVAIRQTMGIFAAMVLVRAGLEPLVKLMRQLFRAQGPWEKSTEYYVLREVGPRYLPHPSLPFLPEVEVQAQPGLHLTPATPLRSGQVYRPLEVLFVIAAVTSFAENFLPQLISLPKVPQMPSGSTCCAVCLDRCIVF